MELVSSIVGPIVEHAWGPIKRHLGYLIFYKRKIDKMEIKFNDELDPIREDVQRRVEAAASERLEEVDSAVEVWLKKVKDADEEVKRIKDELSTSAANNNNKGCLYFRLHHRLGRQAADQIQTIDDLVNKGKFDRVSHSRPPPSTTGSLLVNYEGYAKFESRESCLNEILNAFKDENVHMIGVYGMAGIGKTTLVKEAANKAMDGLFTEVVMVTVSQNLDVKRIQTDMAQSLSLQLDDKTNVEVGAGMIEERLRKEGSRVLVILDDLWEMLELSKVRIPHDRNNKGTCKVLITTRREDVCDQMDCQKKVELRTLSDEESWSLFKSRAGNVVESLTMKEVAQNVAKQCAGLPLALVVLGTALKGKKLDVWKIVLNQLKKSTMALDLPGVSNKVRQSIELSYNFLESEAAKWCFLHCCLYPEDYHINYEDELMHMLVGGGLLEDVESLHEAQDRVHVLMDQLKASGLLLEGVRKGRYVRMHDVVRDVAIWIGERDHGFFVRAGQGLKEWPRNSTDEKKLQNIQRLSLMSNEIDGLPSDPKKCTKLETLILRKNWKLSNIPEIFFQHMGALKVLDLRVTNISCLPESISCLTSLRVLKLEECNDISPINGLKMLEILVLNKDTREVSVVPEDTGKLPQLESVLQPFQCLPNLKYLEISNCGLRCGLLIAYHEMEMAAADPFPKLERLEIRGCREMRQMISSSSPDAPLQGMCIVFQNLTHLYIETCPRLTHLFWSKQAKHIMQQLTSLEIIHCESLTAVVISNENQEQEGASASTSTSTSTTACAFVDHHHGSQYSIFPRLTKLVLNNLPQLESVLQPFQCLPNLMTLLIWHCGLRCGLAYHHEMEMAGVDPFPKLEELDIRNCLEMSQMISSSSSPDAPLQAGMCIVFQNLSDLYIERCPRLTHLFWSKQAKHMQQLTLLEIRSCRALTAVVISNENQEEEGASASTSTSTSTSTTACAVVDDHHGSQYNFFPRLTKLNLMGLPQLESVLQPFQCLPNLMELRISFCGLRCGLAYHEMEMAAADPFPKLEQLYIYIFFFF